MAENIFSFLSAVFIAAVFAAFILAVKSLCKNYIKGQYKNDDK